MSRGDGEQSRPTSSACAGRADRAHRPRRHAPLLRRLGKDGLIEIHPSHQRRPVPRLPRGPSLAWLTDEIDRPRRGGRASSAVTPPSEPIFRAVMDRVVPLVSQGSRALAFVAFGLSAALSCISCTPHAGRRRGRRRSVALGHPARCSRCSTTAELRRRGAAAGRSRRPTRALRAGGRTCRARRSTSDVEGPGDFA